MDLKQLAGHEKDLGFKPSPAVRWLSPPQLVCTGVRALIAHTLAGFSDNRETQSLFAQQALDLSAYLPSGGGTWIDFVADLGDGFDATYTIACLLAQPHLQVAAGAQEILTLPKGQLLVMGGDQVYPSASSRNYEDRLIKPYRAASEQGPAAALLALPGNHDWYDGLSSFMRSFCQQAPIGGWQTLQSRGYFAARLSNTGGAGTAKTWWLVGLDSELGAYIDRPQLEYFDREISSQLRDGDAIILCAASPTWAATNGIPHADPDANNSLRYFEDHFLLNRRDPATGTMRPTGAQIRLRLSGDKHHYARYAQRVQGVADTDPRAEQLVTCGLGGAYLMATDQLATDLTLPPPGSRVPSDPQRRKHYTLAAARYPTAGQAKKMYWQLLLPWSEFWLPRRNPWFGFWLGGVHLALFTFLTTVFAVATSRSYPAALGSGHWEPALGLIAFCYAGPPLLVFAGRWASRRTRADEPGTSQRQTAVMVGLQLLLSALFFMLAVWLPWTTALPGGWALAFLAAALVAVLGYVAGSLVFALHVILAPPGSVGKLKMTALAHEGGKGFVRMHLAEDGELTLYPLLIDEVVHDWRIQSRPSGNDRPVPAGGLPRMRLIEHPVRITRSGFDPEGSG